MKLTMPKDTVKRTIILGTNWKETLKEVIDLDVLPEFLGGKHKIDLENGDWASINPGPWNDP